MLRQKRPLRIDTWTDGRFYYVKQSQRQAVTDAFNAGDVCLLSLHKERAFRAILVAIETIYRANRSYLRIRDYRALTGPYAERMPPLARAIRELLV